MPVAIHPNDLLISTTTARTDYHRIIYDKKKCFKRCCLYSVLILFVLITIPFVINMLDFKLKDLKVLGIDSLTASNFNLSSRPNQFSADWNIQMSFKTMNKRGYYRFSNTKVSVYYNDKRIALKKIIRPFHLSSKHTPMHFGEEFSGSSGYINDSVIRNIGQGITAGNMRFNIVFEARVGKNVIKGWPFKGVWDDLVGYCEDVELFFGSPNVSKARMINGSHKCQLYYKNYDLFYDDTYAGIHSCFETYGWGPICVKSRSTRLF